MTAVSKTTLTGDIYNAIYGMITGSITDTQSPTRAVNQWCFASWPSKTRFDSSDFPIIVIDKAEVSNEDWTLTKTMANFSISITIYMAGDKSAENCDSLSDQVYNILDTNQYTNLRNDKRLYRVVITGESSDVVQFEGIKLHTKMITIGGVFRH